VGILFSRNSLTTIILVPQPIYDQMSVSLDCTLMQNLCTLLLRTSPKTWENKSILTGFISAFRILLEQMKVLVSDYTHKTSKNKWINYPTKQVKAIEKNLVLLTLIVLIDVS